MRIGIALILLLGVAWGEPLVLLVFAPSGQSNSFPGPGEGWWVEDPLKALHLSDPKGPPPYLAVVEVPPTTPPGVYRVCLGADCREVKVEERRRLEVHLPPSARGKVTVHLRNRGNLEEVVTLRPGEDSQVRFSPLRVSLEPGEEKSVLLPLDGGGLLLLEVHSGGERKLYAVRVAPEDPLSPSLKGKVFGGTGGLGLEASLLGPDGKKALRFGLERAWSGEASLGLHFQAPGLGLSLSSHEPHLQVDFAGRGVDGTLWAGEGGLGGRATLSASPFRLWTALQLLPKPSLKALGLGYAEGPVALSAAWPLLLEGQLGFPGGGVLVRVEEGGSLLRLSLPPFLLEGGIKDDGTFRFYTDYSSRYEGVAYRLGMGYSGLPYLVGSIGYGGVSLEGRLGGDGSSLHGRLEGREGDWSFRGRAGLGPLGLVLGLEVQGDLDPWSLRLEGEWREGGGRVSLQAGYRFSFGLPAEAGLLLGYPLPALLEGESLPKAQIRLVFAPSRQSTVGDIQGVADERGRFALRLPPGAHRVQALPPPGVLGLPVEERVELGPGERAFLRLLPRRAVKVKAVCKEGSGQVRLLGEGGELSLPCGKDGLLPEGRYRVEALPARGYRLRTPPESPLLLGYGEERSIEALFEAIPVERERPQRLIPIAFFSLEGTPTQVAAPGETLRVEAPGAERLVLLGVGDLGPLPLTTLPMDLPPGVYLLEALGPGGKGVVELTVDRGRPLFLTEFSPPRPVPGEKVRVLVQPRTLVQEVVLRLPWGEVLPLSEEGGRFRGEFVLPDFLEGGKVVLLEGIGRVQGGRELPFRVALPLR